MREIYEFDAEIHEVRDSGGAYVIFPWDIRREFGAGRVKVSVLFDGIAYDGSIVNMGVKNQQRDICYIIGMRKVIREQLGKSEGEDVEVTVRQRLPGADSP